MNNKTKNFPLCGMIGLHKTMSKRITRRGTRARIYQYPGDSHGIVLSGEVVSFYLGTEGWNLVMKGSRVVEEHPDLFDIINDLNQEKTLKGEFEGEKPKSKAEIGKDNTVWLGFRIDSGVRVQIYKE